MAAARGGEEVRPPRSPPAVAQFPWEEVKDEISAEALVTLTFFVRLVLHLLRDERSSQVTVATAKNGRQREAA